MPNAPRTIRPTEPIGAPFEASVVLEPAHEDLRAVVEAVGQVHGQVSASVAVRLSVFGQGGGPTSSRSPEERYADSWTKASAAIEINGSYPHADMVLLLGIGNLVFDFCLSGADPSTVEELVSFAEVAKTGFDPLPREPRPLFASAYAQYIAAKLPRENPVRHAIWDYIRRYSAGSSDLYYWGSGFDPVGAQVEAILEMKGVLRW